MSFIDFSSCFFVEELTAITFINFSCIFTIQAPAIFIEILPASVCQAIQLSLLSVFYLLLSAAYINYSSSLTTAILYLIPLFTNFTQLCLYYSISSLKNIEVLNLQGNKLSESLPDDIFTSLLSLRELNMCDCELIALPNRCVYTRKLSPLCNSIVLYLSTDYVCCEYNLGIC